MRMSSYGRLSVLVLALAAMLLLVLRCERFDRTQPEVKEGTLDLSGWNFDAYGPARLDGQWEFLWGGLAPPGRRGPLNPDGPADRYAVPALWQNSTALGRIVSARGLAAYRLRVRLAPDRGPYALYLSGMLSVCRVWADGRLIGSSGDFDPNGRETPRKHLVLPVFDSSSPETELTIEVANRDNSQGGLNTSILLGTDAQVRRLAARRWLAGACVAGVLLAMGVYHLIVFDMRRSDRSNLYFGLFSLAWSVATLFSPVSGFVMSEFTSLPWRWHVELALLPHALTIPLMVMLYHSLFPKRWGRQVNLFYISLGAAYSAYLLVSGPTAFGRIPLIYFMVTRSAFFYLAAVFAVDIVRGEKKALLLAPGYLALGYAELSKILFDLHVTAKADFAPYGMLVFIFSYALFMAVRFSQAFSRAERLTGELSASNERLLALDRLKDTFLANAAHELKTPLAGMVGIADAMRAGGAGAMSDQARAHLAILSHSGKRLSRLVDDVLDHDRLENDDVRLAPGPVNLAATAGRVLALARPLASEKGLDLRDALPDDLPPVLADSGRLEQILLNLVGNAIKYTERGFVELSAHVREDKVEVRVSDSGVGVALEDQKRLFTPYTRLCASDRGAANGAGLGLAIAKRLVELHGSRLGISSTSGRGSVFRFALPLSEDPGAPVAHIPEAAVPARALDSAPPPLPPGARGPKYDVLVVDDEPVILHVVATCLEVAHMTVKAVRSGQQALDLLAEGDDPGVVLLDVMMPGLDGYDVCRKIRATRGAASQPVVMLTCRDRVEDVVAGFAAGANDYVTKPFAREELVARVSTQLDLRRAHRVLEENASLRREVVMRRKTEQELRLRQIRLSGMLDAVGEAVFAVNPSGEVAFCNQSFADLTGLAAQEALGQPLASLLADPTAPDSRRLLGELDSMLHGADQTRTFERVDMATRGRSPLRCRVRVIRLELAEEPLLLAHLGSAGKTGGHDAEVLADMLRKVEGNRLRLQGIGEALQSVSEEGAGGDVLKDLHAIDAFLETLSERIRGDWDEEEEKILAVQVMQTALDCWTEATGQGKGELAVQSGLWNTYMERDGYLRTQTLDKYLNPATLPKRPRWHSIVATAEYVLSACPHPTRQGDALRRLLDRLRQAVSGARV